jgi:hypothetical protein
LKESDDVNEIARKHRPGEWEERALTMPKSSDIGGGRSRAFKGELRGF